MAKLSDQLKNLVSGKKSGEPSILPVPGTGTGEPPAPPVPGTGEPPAPPAASTGEPPAPPAASTGEPPAPFAALTGEPPAPLAALTGEPPAPLADVEKLVEREPAARKSGPNVGLHRDVVVVDKQAFSKFVIAVLQGSGTNFYGQAMVSTLGRLFRVTTNAEMMAIKDELMKSAYSGG